MVEERVRSTPSIGFFTVIAIFILFTVLLVTGALYFYKGSLEKNITEMEKSLNLAKGSFEPDKIAELQVLDKRLKASSEILAHHIDIIPIFKALQAITMKTVRYTNFSYDLGNQANANVTIKINGLAIGYRSVALQADLFATKDEGKNFINPIFSNLTLDDKGDVLFDLQFSVDPSFVNYKTAFSAEGS